jgi:hypothetical protein
MKKICIVSFPRVGLANKLIIWANAIVFSHRNDYQLICQRWWHFPIGNIIREKRITRFYYNYFEPGNTITIFKWLILLKFRRKIYASSGAEKPIPDYIYVFNKYPTEINPFVSLKESRNLIHKEFFNIISSKIINQLNNYKISKVSVHVRLGDFKKINPVNSSSLGHTRLCLSYYEKVILTLRDKLGITSFTVFSDGDKFELNELLNIPEVSLLQSGNDLLDLLLMSKSDIIVCSPSSTYGYWAAYISDADVIHHPNYKILTRPSGNYFEGTLDEYINQVKK